MIAAVCHKVNQRCSLVTWTEAGGRRRCCSKTIRDETGQEETKWYCKAGRVPLGGGWWVSGGTFRETACLRNQPLDRGWVREGRSVGCKSLSDPLGRRVNGHKCELVFPKGTVAARRNSEFLMCRWNI